MSPLLETIVSDDPALRDRPLEAFTRGRSVEELLAAASELEAYRRAESNLYRRVRALFYLYALHRFHLPALSGFSNFGKIPFSGHSLLLDRRFEESITQTTRFRARWPKPTTRSHSKPSPTRFAPRCARRPATPGCSAWVIRPTIRCACAGNCSGARGTAPFQF
jgi:hypothetical protein